MLETRQVVEVKLDEMLFSIKTNRLSFIFL